MAENNLITPNNISLLKLLDGLPDFIDKRNTSNNYNIHKPVGDMIDFYLRDLKIVEMRNSLDRPIKLWINQQLPHTYKVNYQVSMLQGIDNVQLYLDGSTPTLLKDSGNLDATTTYSDFYLSTSETIIPTGHYFLKVTDSLGNIYKNGYPENDVPQGDIYDHDDALDDFGVNWLIPRRTYKTGLDEEEYPNTTPPFFIQATEADYWYEQRIRQFISDYHGLKLPVAEIRRNMSILPTLIGRWRGTGDVDDSCIMDIIGYLEDIPSNINFATAENCQLIVDRACPCGKKCNMIFASKTPVANEFLILEDSFNVRWQPQQLFNILTEHLNISGQDIALFQDTDIDFKSDILNNCVISGTGPSAILTVGGVFKSPNGWSQYNTLARYPWVGNANAINMADGNAVSAKIRHYTAAGGSPGLRAWNFNFNVPEGVDAADVLLDVDAVIKTSMGGPIQVSVGQSYKQHNGGSWGDSEITDTITIDATTSFQKFALVRDLPLVYPAFSLEGDPTPAEIVNDPSFGPDLTFSTYFTGLYDTDVYVDHIEMRINHGSGVGTAITKTINPPKHGTGWYQLTANKNTPSNTSITWNIYNSITEALLLSTESLPIDLTGLPWIPLKVEMVLESDTEAETPPSIDWFKVWYNKTISLP